MYETLNRHNANTGWILGGKWTADRHRIDTQRLNDGHKTGRKLTKDKHHSNTQQTPYGLLYDIQTPNICNIGK